MELYTLDSLYRRIAVIDKFESLIWTERYWAFGDFELILPSTLGNRNLLKSGTKLAMNESYRVMQVEIIEDTVDDEGIAMLKVRGRSLEMILEDRALVKNMTDAADADRSYISPTDTPGNLMRGLFDTFVRTPTLSADDDIPLLQPGSIFAAGSIAEPTETLSVKIKPTTLYKGLNDLGQMYALGFRLIRNFDMSQLYFDVYTGNNRTTSQDDFPAVIFSPDLDNLKNTTELTSVASYKNAAYVFCPVGTVMVYPLDVDPSVTGFERKVLLVDAMDIDETDHTLAVAEMTQRGKEALAKQRRFTAFDGEINQTSSYKYGVDYNLGDLVEMRNVDGATNEMLVIEQIFVSDAEGERSYPTLSVNIFITPGSWLAWDFNQVWEDFTTEHWADLP